VEQLLVNWKSLHAAVSLSRCFIVKTTTCRLIVFLAAHEARHIVPRSRSYSGR
jgi:hypothetical protein